MSGLQLGWLEPAEGHDVALILIAFVFPLQLLASTFGYLSRDVVAGTGMGLLAGTWLSIGLITLTADKPGTTSDALGLFLLLAAAAMLVPASAASAGKLVAAAVLFTTAVRFAATGLYELTASGFWENLAGIVGLILCALAVYAAAGLALEDARHRTILPMGRRGLGRDSFEGGFGSQLAGLEHEAGVREQL